MAEPKTLATHLKSLTNGRVFLRTKPLAERKDMIPCDAEGNMVTGHITDIDDVSAGPERRVTPYLGSTTNGVLYRYTPMLALRDDMVSIDTPEQWDVMKNTGEAPEPAPDVVAPVLTRSTPATPAVPAEEPKTKIKPLPNTGGIQLPSIEGIGAREAKTILAQWAEENFNMKIDRRPGLPEVVQACKDLLATSQAAAAAAGA